MSKKELILLFIGNNCKKYTKKQIEQYVKDNIDKELAELELEGIIYIDTNGLISSFPSHLEIGRILIQNDRPILIKDNKRYAIRKEDLKGARHNDLVIIKKTNLIVPHNKTKYTIAKVEKILRRDTYNIIVEVKEKDNKLFVEALHNFLDGNIINHNSQLKNYTSGDILLVEVKEPDKNNNYHANIVELIAHENDPDKEIKILLVKNGFPLSLSEKSMKEMEEIPEEVRPADLVGRKDLRKILTFSIDGERTKDRDDAISLLTLPNGNYLFICHISDVSHYIHPGMHLWDEVIYRGSSVYPSDLVNHMIHAKIATGICSLNEKVDRLTESTFIEIDPFGNIVNYYSKSAIINSKKACTYEDVNRFLEKDKHVEGYEELEETLKQMEHVMYLLRDKMIKNGMLEFNVGDTVIVRNKEGKIVRIFDEKMGTAQKIIEFFMLITDMVNAESAILPMVYRVHEAPDIATLEQTCEILRKTIKTIKIPRRITCAKQLQNLLEQLHGLPEEEYATRLLIQSMKRARYSADNIGHFALGVKGDEQITSPIRRAGDLHNQYYTKLQRTNKRFTDQELKELYIKTDSLCRRLNQVELAAERVEYEAKRIAMKEYLTQNGITTQNGIITFLNNKLVLVRTEDGIEGRLDLNGLYAYDKATNTFRHRNNNFRLVLGSPVTLIPKQNDTEITFALKK